MGISILAHVLICIYLHGISHVRHGQTQFTYTEHKKLKQRNKTKLKTGLNSGSPTE